MKKIRNKLHNRKGFSLAETLMAVLILLMVSAVVAAGIPMAREAYEKAVDAANAQTLLSTTITMLRSELGESQYISGGGEGGIPVVYLSGRTGLNTTLSRPSSTDSTHDRGLFLSYTVNGNPTTWYLVTSQSATKRLKTDFDSITYESATGLYTVKGLRVERDGSGTIATLETLEIRTVNP